MGFGYLRTWKEIKKKLETDCAFVLGPFFLH
jgi:hypothetical protein